jgi:hypothetical protein
MCVYPVCKEPHGEKYDVARAHGIACVGEPWLAGCASSGSLVPVHGFQLGPTDPMDGLGWAQGGGDPDATVLPAGPGEHQHQHQHEHGHGAAMDVDSQHWAAFDTAAALKALGMSQGQARRVGLAM